ncbi:MAG: hypothetical protein JWO84_297 [Parcubacteria group bacterium]|nr:hypothetical protein [Parcubacteria group bacterium]
MRAAIRNHLEKTAATVEVLLIFLQVLRQFLDLTRKKRNLNVRRSGIALVARYVLNDGGLYSFRKHCQYLTTP